MGGGYRRDTSSWRMARIQWFTTLYGRAVNLDIAVMSADAARFVGQQAIQLHGGMGVTEEMAVSHYFKRLTCIAALFGDVDHHLGVVSDVLLAA